jgi:hypothetical protein
MLLNEKLLGIEVGSVINVKHPYGIGIEIGSVINVKHLCSLKAI